MARDNNTTKNNMNYNFRAGCGRRGRQNHRNNSRGRGGKGWNKPKNNGKSQKDDKFQESENDMIKYNKTKIIDDEVKWKFLIYGETSETTMMMQTYEGYSDEELLSAII